MSDRRRLERITIQFNAVAYRLERLARHAESWAAERPLVTAVAFTLPFLLDALVRAGRRPLWFDEILSEYISALPSMGAIWTALSACAESTPPLFHVVTKICGDVFGWNPIALRLPAVGGFLTMTLCVYFILRPYVGPLYAVLGALAGYLTNAASYASQVRPYGLLLGFTAVALLSWQCAARNQRRTLALAGLCVGLAAAQSVHYYAFLSFAAIGAGEVVRTWTRRRVDWPVWAALVLAFIPLVFFASLVRANMALKEGFFARVTPTSLVAGLCDTYLPPPVVLQAAFVVSAALWAFAFGRRAQPERLARPPLHELAAWLALFLAPVLAFIVGYLATKVFVARYSLITIIGFSLLLPFLLQRLLGNSRAGALALVLLLLSGMSYYVFVPKRSGKTSAQLLQWLDASDPERLPVVIAHPLRYLELAHDSASEPFSRNLLYIPDTSQALHYTGTTTPDYNLQGLRSTGRLNLPRYSEFTRSHRHFLLLWEQSVFDWIVPKLRDEGARLTLRNHSRSQMLFTVELTTDPRTHLPESSGASQ